MKTILLSVSLGLLASVQSALETADEAKAVGWLRTAAVPFASDLRSPALDRLADRLKAARVIGIGEATHGSHEDEAFKTQLIETLVRRGQIDVVAVEANHQAGVHFDDYVERGIGDPAAAVASDSFFKIWKNDEFADLVLWLRAWNRASTRQVRMISIDCQDGGTDAARALTFVAQADPKDAARLREGFAPLVSEAGFPERYYTFIGHAKRADWQRVDRTAVALAALFSARASEWRLMPGFDEARYSADLAVQALDVYEFDIDGGSELKKAPAGYYDRRDRYMAANLLTLAGESARVALWAHDLHIASAPAGFEETTLGNELSRHLGRAYQVVGFTWGHGSFNAVRTTQSGATMTLHRPPIQENFERNDEPGDIGYPLAAVGPANFWVDLRTLPSAPWAKRWSTRPYYRGYEGWMHDFASWQNDPKARIPLLPGIDILVYHRTLTPSNFWPLPPSPTPAAT